MKPSVKQIAPPSTARFRVLTPVELNGMHFSTRHTVLTADVLARAAAKALAAAKIQADSPLSPAVRPSPVAPTDVK